MSFDFHAMVQLARTDPAVFEAERRKLIDALIISAPEHMQSKLVASQSTIDRLCASISDPIQRAEELCILMAAALDEQIKHLIELAKLAIQDGQS